MASTRPLRIATRGSTLARWQAEHVASLLGGDVELVVVSTAGDRRTDVPIHEIGGRGVFTKEVQVAVLDGRADLAVHSAKDLPARPDLAPDGLVIAAVPERADPRDCLVGSTLDHLPVGGRVGTGSVRRRAQLAHLRTDLTFGELRGNIETRLEKASAFDAIVVAVAALQRLGRLAAAVEILEPWVLLPQVGQGALAVECRVDDDEVRGALAAIEHGPSRLAVDAERGFLAALGGGCDLPVGAHATAGDTDGALVLDGLLASLDGRVVLRERVEIAPGDDVVKAGTALAETLLEERGGRALLADLGPTA